MGRFTDLAFGTPAPEPAPAPKLQPKPVASAKKVSAPAPVRKVEAPKNEPAVEAELPANEE
jgi:hypothetical protein